MAAAAAGGLACTLSPRCKHRVLPRFSGRQENICQVPAKYFVSARRAFVENASDMFLSHFQCLQTSGVLTPVIVIVVLSPALLHPWCAVAATDEGARAELLNAAGSDPEEVRPTSRQGRLQGSWGGYGVICIGTRLT
eukprot:710558-Rhodomonas_salina.1